MLGFYFFQLGYFFQVLGPALPGALRGNTRKVASLPPHLSVIIWQLLGVRVPKSWSRHQKFVFTLAARSTVRDCGSEDDWQHYAGHLSVGVHVCRYRCSAIQGKGGSKVK